MGICGSKRNKSLIRLGSSRNSSGSSSNSSLYDCSGDLQFQFSDMDEMNKFDLINYHIKPPPNILSPSPESGYLESYIPPRFQNGVGGYSHDPFHSLADGPIKCEILIHGYIRNVMHSITNTKLIPRCIVSAVKLYFFPQHIVMELGASTDSFYTNFKMSHSLSSPKMISSNGTNDDILLCTRNDAIYHSTERDPRRFRAVSFLGEHKEEIEGISHGISNKHCFITTNVNMMGLDDLTITEQHIYCIGHNQFGQCGTGTICQCPHSDRF